MSLPTTQSISLPEVLQPWQTWLSWLDPELIPAFSDVLQRLLVKFRMNELLSSLPNPI